MRITSGGNVLLNASKILGINTADGSDTSYLAIAGADGDGTTRAGHIYLSGNERATDAGSVVLAAGTTSTGTGATGAIVFRTNGSDVARITSSGNVLIGTTTDDGKKLRVIGGNTEFRYDQNGTSYTYLRNWGAGGSVGLLFGLSTDDDVSAELLFSQNTLYIQSYGDPGSSILFGTRNATESAIRMKIDQDGKVGIGTTTPFSKLDVSITSTQALFIANESGTISDGDLLGAVSFGSRDGSTYSSGGITNIRSYATATYNTGNVSGDMRFYVSSSLQNTTQAALFGTEAMRINSGGNLLINTTTDNGARLDVNGNAIFRVTDGSTTTGGFTITNDGATPAVAPWPLGSSPVLFVTSSNVGNPHIGINQSSNDAEGAKIIGYKSRGTTDANSNIADGDELLSIAGWGMHTSGPNQYKFGGDITWIKNDGGGTASSYVPSDIRFRTASDTVTVISAMTLKYNGNLLIGTTTDAGYRLQVVGDARITSGSLGVGVAPNATDGRIDASNDIVAFQTSDRRLKENITPIANALDKVKSLTGVEFDWKEETKHVHGYEGHDTGIIAQEVQAVMPTAVRTNDSGYLSVRYEKLISLLVEANKELAARVEELEAKLK